MQREGSPGGASKFITNESEIQRRLGIISGESLHQPFSSERREGRKKKAIVDSIVNAGSCLLKSKSYQGAQSHHTESGRPKDKRRRGRKWWGWVWDREASAVTDALRDLRCRERNARCIEMRTFEDQQVSHPFDIGVGFFFCHIVGPRRRCLCDCVFVCVFAHRRTWARMSDPWKKTKKRKKNKKTHAFKAAPLRQNK